MTRGYLVVVLLFLFVLALEVRTASTQQSEYPMMDKIAQKVIDKYQNSSCEDLKAQRQQSADPQQAATKQKVVGLLKSDPKMRAFNLFQKTSLRVFSCCDLLDLAVIISDRVIDCVDLLQERGTARYGELPGAALRQLFLQRHPLSRHESGVPLA
jgi:hypothetical protein